MRAAIMQPYILPYVGYFQLIHSVDTFYLFDDVAYINKGWVNRNRILINGAPNYFVLPIEGASQNKTIDTLFFTEEKWREKLEKTVLMSYKKAPNFERAFELFKSILWFEDRNVSAFLYNSLKEVCAYLEIETTLVQSTSIFENQDLKGQDRILDICSKSQVTTYINPPGGVELYEKSRFEEKGIELLFLKPNLMPYKQIGSAPFEPGLSILDLLMNCDHSFLQEQIKNYQFITNG
jgi:hypothetical protein